MDRKRISSKGNKEKIFKLVVSTLTFDCRSFRDKINYFRDKLSHLIDKVIYLFYQKTKGDQMLEKISVYLTNQLFIKGELAENKIEVIKYGFKILISSLLILLSILLYAGIMFRL